ncbi:sigma-70 family RNA polymerase sigma factor [Polaribacter sp. MSW13]|uniref:Sigma-70 family RNA polymerase sigma factor n=1 Tax=Polaribacter marinus TaxID=2916838 RepID=A0A9X2AK87_9FLAO|nr:sigma-70 family RNA polymerase sigma factor [Polaribacter marinus]MCI2229812.1 sigma-70 family RNA polymerase sigma factor [Polaribacter marinus]
MQSNSNKNTQEDLWKLFMKGDMNAFHQIYDFHYQMMYNFGLRYINAHEVTDCLHDTFLNIIHYKDSISEVTNVKAYLFKSLRNQIYKVKKTKKIEFELLDGTVAYEEDNTNKEKVLKELKLLIEKLSPREKEIIYLKYFQGFNNFEISELLEIKYQTVRNILAVAIKKLRKLGSNFIEILFLLLSK